MARIRLLAFALTKAWTGRLDVDQIIPFIQVFQTVTAPTIGETWALALMLRLSLLETLADALAHITHLDLPPASYPNNWPAAPDGEPVAPLLNDETIVINSISGLRMLATQDWQVFFESVCVVESILSEDPIDVYRNMDFDTRNSYRNVIEEIALGTQA